MHTHDDWRLQLKTSIRTPKALREAISLTLQEEAALVLLEQKGGLPLGITPHFLSLMDLNNENDPLRLQMVPRVAEFAPGLIERRDPLGEEDHEVVPNLVHRYPDRVLLLITDRCGSYCRFCTRKRWVGQGPSPQKNHLDQALWYIENHPEVKEVLVSGGDALLLDDDSLKSILARLRAIPSVDIIRLATRLIVFAPTRVTQGLIEILKAHQPVFIMSHINHPNELDEKAKAAILALSDNGIPVYNQTVLLKGVNDDAKVLSALFRELTKLRARPYYLHQCDIAPGTAQFRVPIDNALNLVGQLRGHISGLSMPTFALDIPGGFGKVSLVPNPIVDRDENFVYLKGFDGEVAKYPVT